MVNVSLNWRKLFEACQRFALAEFAAWLAQRVTGRAYVSKQEKPPRRRPGAGCPSARTERSGAGGGPNALIVSAVERAAACGQPALPHRALARPPYSSTPTGRAGRGKVMRPAGRLRPAGLRSVRSPRFARVLSSCADQRVPALTAKRLGVGGLPCRCGRAGGLDAAAANVPS